MAKPQIQIFENLETISRQAAKRFCELAVARASSGRDFTCALSGGSTPQRLYELLATPEYSIPWQRVHLFQVDERTVSPDDRESNYRMIREVLLSKVPLPTEHFYRIAAERADRNAVAREYAAELERILQPTDGGGLVWTLCSWAWGRTGIQRRFFRSRPRSRSESFGSCRITVRGWASTG